MALRINQNIEAANAYRNLSVTQGQMAKSLEKLSSGFRINRAADDAAGLSISEGLRAQIGGLKVAVRNSQDGVSVVQTAEGALTETHSILQRMRDLAVQAARVVGLHGQVTHALENAVRLGERTFRRLHDADAVLGVADGDLEATDLRAQALGDGQTGGVVGRAVDTEAGGQLLQRLAHLAVGDGQVAVRVERRDVVVDAQTHDVPPWKGPCSSATSVQRRPYLVLVVSTAKGL
jgi:hypothetical protein